jgi:HEAT repeat protein
MKSLLWLLVVSLLVGCGVSQSEPHIIQQVKLPDFVDDAKYRRPNEELAAPRQKLIYFRNLDAMHELFRHDTTLVRQEMVRRLAPDQPMSLRLIAATVLALKNDEQGKQFFIAQSKIPQGLGDVYVTFDHLAGSAKALTGSEADLSWAEDLMIEALQNRTRVSKREALQSRINSSDRMIEIREMAVYYGGFATHLAKMRSEKGLPVILSLLREYQFYTLNMCIAHLGGYKDERVGPVVLDILRKHQDAEGKDTYGPAVRAASDLKLKAAVPILLRHLDDPDSYAGLKAVADASVIPTIKAALPRLKSDARAEAELTLIHLNGDDVVPPLLRLFGRQEFERRFEIMSRFEELRDPRTVATAASALCNDKDAGVRYASMRMLAAMRSREAMQGLISGLGCDYFTLERPKTSPDYDYNGEYREAIAKTLQKVTGENFGVDQQRWALWLNQQRAF